VAPVIDAARCVMESFPDVDDALRSRITNLLRRLGVGRASIVPSAGLSPRERQVVGLLAGGASAQEVASRIGVTLSTVETYRTRAYQKTGCKNLADLTRFAIREGLVS